MSIGESLKSARARLGISQADVAAHVGVSQPMISNWERGIGEPAAEFIPLLESILGAIQTEDTGSQAPMLEPLLQDEDFEGTEIERSQGFGAYPIDSVMIRRDQRTVHDILRRMDKQQVVLDPEFQRAFVWGTDKQSRLIESAIMQIPLPVMYLAEDPDGTLVVVDGRQRLTTFFRFVQNQLRLALPGSSLDGQRFADLEPRLQSRVEDTQLTLYVIDSKIADRVRLDIFERVNGGEPLSRQQMRNCIYSGTATRWLKDAAELPGFQGLFGRVTLDKLTKSMRDREILNRFVAFRLLGYRDYNGNMDDFLGKALKALNRSPQHGESLMQDLERSIAHNVALFGSYAFRKHTHASERPGTRFNLALWDIWSTLLSVVPSEVVRAQGERIQAAFYELLENDKFDKAITLSTNQQERVLARFQLLEARLREVTGAA